MTQIPRAVTALAAAAMLAGCASAGENGAPDPAVTVQIENNLLPPTTLTVYAVPEAGVRQLIGTVRPNQTATLTVEGIVFGQYRFVGRTTEGREVSSNPIALGLNEAVHWNVDANLVTPM